MKKTMILGILVALVGLAPAVKAQGLCVDLIADGGDATTATDVGEVCVWNDGTNLYVMYQTIGPFWQLNDTHLAICEGSIDCVPEKNGNPKNGQFPWQDPDSSTATSATYVIPLVGNYPGKGKKVGDAYDWTGDELYIAAHGVVGLCSCEDFLEALPDAVDVQVDYPGADSYFDVTITGDGILNGTHTGWCADTQDPIEGDFEGSGDIYATICDDDLNIPEGLIDIPGNLDLVNWLLNNVDNVPGGPYTAGDVQYAIWILLSGLATQEALDSIDSTADGSIWPAAEDYDQTRGDALVAAAEANGDGFEPVCGEVMVVVLVPPVFEEDHPWGVPGEPRQTVLIEVPVPCCETVWGGFTTSDPEQDTDDNGYGLDFWGSNWAMYFTYTVEEVE